MVGEEGFSPRSYGKDTLIVGKIYIFMLWAVCPKTASQYSEQRKKTSTDKHIKPPKHSTFAAQAACCLRYSSNGGHFSCLAIGNHSQSSNMPLCANSQVSAFCLFRGCICCKCCLETWYRKRLLYMMLWPVGRARMSQASPGDSCEAVLFGCTTGFSTTVKIQWVQHCLLLLLLSTAYSLFEDAHLQQSRQTPQPGPWRWWWWWWDVFWLR